MTRARDLSKLLGTNNNGVIPNSNVAVDLSNLNATNLTSGTVASSRLALVANDIPSLDTSKITTGTFADARISQSSVSQHATSFDDSKIQQDLMVLALQQATDANKSAYNLSNSFIEQFEDSTGIDVQTNTSRDASEYVSTVAATTQSQISFAGATVIGNMTQNAGLSSAIDGVLGGAGFANGARLDPSAGANIGVDWGSGNSHIITRAKIWGVNNYGIAGDTSNRYGKLQGSNNNSTWTDLFTISNIKTISNIGSNTANTPAHDVNHLTGDTFSSVAVAYRYHRWLFEGDGNGGTVSEIQFFSGGLPSFNSTGNFTSVSQTAPATVSKMGIVVLYKNNAGTATLNTDLVAQVSANNGTNYTTVTLTPRGTFSTGINIAVANNVTVTSGTSVKYKISFANQSAGTKETQVHGVGLIY